jgi:hypothetical protein
VKPIELLARALRSAIDDGSVTPAELVNLKQLGRTVLDHDDSSAEEIRAQIRWALADRPDVRSFATDSGLNQSTARRT